MTISTMAQALQARDAGMASSAEHAEQDAPGWGRMAYSYVRMSTHLHNMPEFTMEHARSYLFLLGLPEPAELRAWGSVTQKLIRDGIIEPVGYAKAASSNGSVKRTYRICK